MSRIGASPAGRITSASTPSRSASLVKGTNPIARRKPNHCGTNYDELVLQWAMRAEDVSASDRAEILERAADNHMRTKALATAVSSSEDMSLSLVNEDDLSQAMLYNAAQLRALGEHTAHSIQLLHTMDPLGPSAFHRECKLELCHRKGSESYFNARAIWDELKQQEESIRAVSLELLDTSCWRPSGAAPSEASSSTVCVFQSFGRRAPGCHALVPWLRRYDTISLDPSGTIRLIVRTLLFQRDDAARGSGHMKWMPHFGSLLSPHGVSV